MSKHADRIYAAIETTDTSALVNSWRRSILVHKLDPDSKVPPERDSTALGEALEREAFLVSVARPCVDQLHAFLVDPEAMVFVGNREGIVLAQRTDRKRDAWSRQASQAAGSRYTEDSLGTCALGTCVREQRSILLQPGDHFVSACASVMSVSVPIFGPDASLVGSLGCVFVDREGRRSRLKLVEAVTVAYARRIGIELFAKAFSKARLMLASRDGRRYNALLAVDRDDRVVGATHAARKLLHISDERFEAGLSTLDLLGRPEDLAHAEANVIARALVRHGHNRSAVAKALGISRSTLYRKLAAGPPPSPHRV